VKSCLKFEKTASSALILATLSCLNTNLSAAQTVPELNTIKAAAPPDTKLHSNIVIETDAQMRGLEDAEQKLRSNIVIKTDAQTGRPDTEKRNGLAMNAIGHESPNQELPAATDFPQVTPKPEAFPTTSVSEPKPLTPGTYRQVERDNSLREREYVTGVSPHPKSLSHGERDNEFLLPREIPTAYSLQPTQHSTLSTQDVELERRISSETTPVAPIEAAAADEPMEQVTSVTQLSDVRPTDWAYEALRSLVERYGCIAGYPDGRFRGNQAMSRYEFAAGLNACLQQIERMVAGRGSASTSRADLEKLQRLMNEFQVELQTLGTRVDKLEGRTTRLEDNQFSTTTKIFGQAIFGIQGRSNNKFDYFLNRRDNGTPFTDQGTNINLVDNVQLSLFTQLSPRSLLLTGLVAGNGNNNALRLDKYVSLGYEGGTNNNLELSDLNYRQLIGNNLALIVGPVGVNPVNVFRGVNRIESAGSGPLSLFAQRNPIINIGGGGGGIGLDLQLGTHFSLQGVYSANRTSDPINGGIFGGNQGATTAGLQLVASPTDQIDVSIQYINSYSPSGELLTGVGDDLLAVQTINPDGFLRAPMQTNAVGASVEWRVTPSFTVGGWGGYTTSAFKAGSGNVETVNWMAFLNFPDLLGEGNLAGIYVGQPPKIISSDLPIGRNIPGFVNRGEFPSGEGGQPDTTIHLEGFYRFRVTDNISVTPGVIVIFNPNQNSNNDTITIGALRTTFTF